MTTPDPTEEMIKAEIKAAVEILKSDGVHIHKTYAEFQKSQAEDKPENDPKESKEGDPPPPKEPKIEDKPVKAGLWWGTRQ